MHTHPPRSLRRLLLLGVAAAAVLGLVGVSSASAAAYRFWGFFELKGTTWAFASKGPAQVKPADGSVEGWRWAVADTGDARGPRAVVTFDQVCQSTPAKAGSKRVAVVLDFGRAADAESGTPPQAQAACAQVPTTATGADVLAAVATVRNEKGLVCAVDSWPASGCGGAVQTVSAAAKAPDDTVTLAIGDEAEDKTSSKVPYVLGASTLIVLLGAGAIFTIARSRRTDSA